MKQEEIDGLYKMLTSQDKESRELAIDLVHQGLRAQGNTRGQMKILMVDAWKYWRDKINKGKKPPQGYYYYPTIKVVHTNYKEWVWRIQSGYQEK